MTPDAPTRPATGQRAGTVLAAVRGHAEQRPGARATSTATGGVWQRWTWRQLIDHVDRAAAQLAAQGVGPGDPVLLQCRARNESVALDLAVRSLGARVLAVDPVTPADQTRALAIAAGVRFAVTEDLIQADKIAGVPGITRVWTWQARGLARPDGPATSPARDLFEGPVPPGDPDQAPAAALEQDHLVVTDGLHGGPRVVALTDASLASALRRTGDLTQLVPGDRVMVIAGEARAAVRSTAVCGALFAGAELFFPESPATVLRDLAQVRPSVVVAEAWWWHGLTSGLEEEFCGRAVGVRRWPGAWFRRACSDRPATGPAARLIAHPLRRRLGLSGVRLAVSCGAALAPATGSLLSALGVRRVDLYGIAEHWGSTHARSGAGIDLIALGGVEHAVAEDDQLRVRVDDGDWVATGDTARRAGEGLQVWGPSTVGGRALRPAEHEVISRLAAEPLVGAAVAVPGSAQGPVRVALTLRVGAVRAWLADSGVDREEDPDAWVPQVRATLQERAGDTVVIDVLPEAFRLSRGEVTVGRRLRGERIEVGRIGADPEVRES